MKKDLAEARKARERAINELRTFDNIRQFIQKMDPTYQITVKAPRIVEPKDPKVVTYGHYMRLARQIMQKLKRGTASELKEAAIKKGLMMEEEAEPVRQALYTLKRKGLIGVEDPEGAGDRALVFYQL